MTDFSVLPFLDKQFEGHRLQFLSGYMDSYMKSWQKVERLLLFGKDKCIGAFMSKTT